MAPKGTILVCGGAGYIGSHMCSQLSRAGYQPVVFDNFSTGHRWAVKWGPAIDGDLLDVDALAQAFASHRFDAVLHFAAKALVAESTREPGLIFETTSAARSTCSRRCATPGLAPGVFVQLRGLWRSDPDSDG